MRKIGSFQKTTVKILINAILFLKKRMRLVTVKIPEALLEDMDELVRIGLYPNRSSVIRAAVRDLVRRELWDRGGGSYRRALNSNRST